MYYLSVACELLLYLTHFYQFTIELVVRMMGLLLKIKLKLSLSLFHKFLYNNSANDTEKWHIMENAGKNHFPFSWKFKKKIKKHFAYF